MDPENFEKRGGKTNHVAEDFVQHSVVTEYHRPWQKKVYIKSGAAGLEKRLLMRNYDSMGACWPRCFEKTSPELALYILLGKQGKG